MWINALKGFLIKLNEIDEPYIKTLISGYLTESLEDIMEFGILLGSQDLEGDLSSIALCI